MKVHDSLPVRSPPSINPQLPKQFPGSSREALSRRRPILLVGSPAVVEAALASSHATRVTKMKEPPTEAALLVDLAKLLFEFCYPLPYLLLKLIVGNPGSPLPELHDLHLEFDPLVFRRHQRSLHRYITARYALLFQAVGQMPGFG
jgi:hypothetical protein